MEKKSNIKQVYDEITLLFIEILKLWKGSKAMVMAISNQKGGVGKTFTSVNFASYMAHFKIKSLLIDCDFQGNGSDALGTRKQAVAEYKSLMDGIERDLPAEDLVYKTRFPNLNAINAYYNLDEFNDKGFPTNYLSDYFEDVLRKHQFATLDVRPETSDIFRNAMTMTDYVVIPVFPEAASITGLRYNLLKMRERQKYGNKKLVLAGIFISRSEKKNPIHVNYEEKIIDFCKDYNIPYLGKINHSVSVSQSIDSTLPLPWYLIKRKNLPLKVEFLDVLKNLLVEVRDHLEAGSPFVQIPEIEDDIAREHYLKSLNNEAGEIDTNEMEYESVNPEVQEQLSGFMNEASL